MSAGARVLIIDDEEIVLDVCREILEGHNYTVATAPDGAQGLRLVGEFQPDVVFVDLKMPGLSGFEVLERLRTRDPSIVPIVITGYATLASAVEAMQKGAYDFVPKPFTPEEFRLITQRGLEKRRLVREPIALRRGQEMLRENFAAIVAHELKAPLAAVQQNLLLLTVELADRLADAQKERLGGAGGAAGPPPPPPPGAGGRKRRGGGRPPPPGTAPKPPPRGGEGAGGRRGGAKTQT